MKDYSHTEHVAAASIPHRRIFHVGNFRSHVSRGPASGEQRFWFIDSLCQTKVSNYTGVASGLSEEYVLRFQISMHEPSFMESIEAVEKTSHDLSHFRRFESSSIADSFEELSSSKEFEDQID
jgi:hypothetical protein